MSVQSPSKQGAEEIIESILNQLIKYIYRSLDYAIII